jgi:hypothetical protein
MKRAINIHSKTGIVDNSILLLDYAIDNNYDLETTKENLRIYSIFLSSSSSSRV